MAGEEKKRDLAVQTNPARARTDTSCKGWKKNKKMKQGSWRVINNRGVKREKLEKSKTMHTVINREIDPKWRRIQNGRRPSVIKSCSRGQSWQCASQAKIDEREKETHRPAKNR